MHECVDDEEGDDPRSEEAVVSEDGKGKRIHSQSGREDARCNEEQDGHDGAEHCDAFRVVKLAQAEREAGFELVFGRLERNVVVDIVVDVF